MPKYRVQVQAAIDAWRPGFFNNPSAESTEAARELEWIMVVDNTDERLKRAVDWLLGDSPHKYDNLSKLKVGGSLYAKLKDKLKTADPANIPPSSSSASATSPQRRSVVPSTPTTHSAVVASSSSNNSNQHNNYSNQNSQHNNYSMHNNNNNINSVSSSASPYSVVSLSAASALPSPSAMPSAPKPKPQPKPTDVVVNAAKHNLLWQSVVITDIPKGPGKYDYLPQDGQATLKQGAAQAAAGGGKDTLLKHKFWMVFGRSLTAKPPMGGERYARCMGCAALAAFTLVMDVAFEDCTIMVVGSAAYDHYFVMVQTAGKQVFAVDIWNANLNKNTNYVTAWEKFVYNKGKPEGFAEFPPQSRAKDRQLADS